MEKSKIKHQELSEYGIPIFPLFDEILDKETMTKSFKSVVRIQREGVFYSIITKKDFLLNKDDSLLEAAISKFRMDFIVSSYYLKDTLDFDHTTMQPSKLKLSDKDIAAKYLQF